MPLNIFIKTYSNLTKPGKNLFIFAKKNYYILSSITLLIISFNIYGSEDDPGEIRLHKKPENSPAAEKLSDLKKSKISSTETKTKKEENTEAVEPIERAPNLDLKDIVEEPLTPTSKKSITDPDGTKTKTNSNALDKKTKDASRTKNINSKNINNKSQKNTTTDKNIEANSDTKKTEQTEKEIETKDKNSADAIVILDTEVTPGTSTRLAWSPASDITGLAAPTPVLVINGAKKGPTLCLTAAVHGDELNGIEIIRRVMYNIEPEKLHGKLIGIPIVNVLGFQRGSRYLPDRRDLNRFFPGDPQGSLASRIAYSLFNEVISHCDSLIDMHTGSMRRTNLPQIRANMSQPKVAKMVQNFDKTLVVHSPGSAGMLRSASNSAGITSVTLEIGESLRIQEEQIKSGTYSVNSFMDRNGMYPRRFNWGKAQPAYYQSVWVRAQTAGILFSDSKLGDYVQPGQKLGKVTDPITNKVADITSTVNGRIIGMAVNQVVMPGFAAYHIGIRATEDEIIENVIDEAPIPQLQEEINPEE